MNKLWKLCRTMLAFALVLSLTLGLCLNGLTVLAAEDPDVESRKDAILKEFFGDGVTTEEAFNQLLKETETMNGYENQPFQYVPTKNSYYVALGDEVAAIAGTQKTSYVDMLAEALGISYKNLAKAQLDIQDVYTIITENSGEIEKADLITIGWNNFGATFRMINYMRNTKNPVKVTDADWTELVGEENLPLVEDLLDQMFSKLRDQNLSTVDGYDLQGGLEWYAFTYMSNAIHQSQVIEAVRVINPDAVIVLVGTYNDMENVAPEVNGEVMDLGEQMADLVNASNLLSTRNAAAYSRVAYVDAPDVTTSLEGMDTSGYNVKQYVFHIATKRTLPTEDGHAYIKDQIMASISSTCNHIWDEGVVTKNPTCNKDGVKTFSCTWCGQTKTEAVAATGEHTLATREENRKEATCAAAGSYDLVTYCTACGTVTKRETKTIAATGKHTYTSEITVEPGCEESGVRTYTCSTCGHSYTELIAAIGHTYKATVTAPTCTEAGYTTYTCACGHSYVENEVPALGHNYGAWTETKAPTCTETGEESRVCERCGNEETRATETTKHTYNTVVTAPTCTEAGYTTYTCACGHSYVGDEVAALGHNYGEWIVNKAPTCTEAGEESRVCERCGNVETHIIAATEHTYKATVTLPTCTEDGFTTYTCACGHSYVADVVAALGHAWMTTTTNATCCEDGEIVHTCAVCGETKKEVIPATGEHDLTYTDNENGVDHRVTCQNSGKELIAGELHSFADGLCTKCGAQEACQHKWDDGVVTKAATCCATGEKLYTCTACGEQYKETLAVDPNAHTGVNHIENEKAATCTTPGYTGDTVCECGAVIAAGEEIPVLEHSYEAVVTPPTCTEAGYTTYTCACGHSYVWDEVPALDHAWMNISTDATCCEDGETESTCVVCGETKKEVIPATGEHDLTYTDNENGVGHRVTCQNSGKELKANELHSFADGLCTKCGAVEVCQHQWDDGVVTKAATCCATGEKLHTCANCGEQYKETLAVDPNAHTGVNHIENEKTPTCTTPGYTGDTVCECGAVIASGEEIAVLEHNYQAAVTAPTCTAGGYTTYTCADCGASYVADQTQPLGHAWDDGVVTKEPTDTTDGEMTYTCTVCGEQKTEVIEKTGEKDVIYDLPENDTVDIPENDCFQGGTTVKVEQLEDGDIFDAVQQAMKNREQKYVAYEFTATMDGAAVQPNGKLTVTFVIPEGYSNNVTVYHMAANGQLVELACVVDADARTITVELEHFGTYIVADEDSAPDVLMGDVNGDGRVNVRDARMILRYIAGLIDASELNLDVADFNGDTRINVRDARAILRSIAGLG